MKKYSIILLGVILSILVIIISVGIYNRYELMDYDIETKTFVYEFSEEDIIKKLDIDIDWLKDYKVLSSLSNLEYERIMLFCVQEGYMEDIKRKANDYLDALKIQFSDDADEIEKQCKVFAKDDIYIMVISQNANTIIKQLKERKS